VFTGGGAAGAVFAHTDCTDAGFERADLANTRRQGALLTDTSFTGCRMTGAALTSLRGIGYTIAQCKGIDLSGQNLEGLRTDEVDLSGADLNNTVWVESRLREVSWAGASFAGADLRGADLGEPTLAQAGHLRGATITPAQAGILLGGWGSWWPRKSLQTLRAPRASQKIYVVKVGVGSTSTISDWVTWHTSPEQEDKNQRICPLDWHSSKSWGLFS